MIVFVLGPGRCGSSAIARVLHTLLGVTMGDKFREPDRNNPKGYWEDLTLKNHNGVLISSDVVLAQWVKKLAGMIQEKEEPWGFKDPRLSYTLGHYLALLPQAKVIRCVKNVHSIAKSMCQAYGWPYVEALNETAKRESNIDRLSIGANELSIDMNQRQSDEMLAEGMRGFVNA